MAQTIEAQVANQIAHQERTARILARTGGEIIHPDHYELREAVRNAVLTAIDAATSDLEFPRMSDGDLPNLFKALDAIAERVFLKRSGL